MNICIRDWSLRDIDNLAKHANSKSIADNLRNTFPHPYTIKNAEWFINFCLTVDKRKDLLLAIDCDGEAVGSISLSIKEDVNCKCAELGYWIGKDFWNKGIVTKSISLICEKGFSDYDIVRIYAEFFEYNTASQRVLEKCGFEFEGRLKKSIYKNGTICDSLIYALTK